MKKDMEDKTGLKGGAKLFLTLLVSYLDEVGFCWGKEDDEEDDVMGALLAVQDVLLEVLLEEEPAAEPEPAPSSDDELFQPAEEEDKDAQIAALKQEVRTLKLLFHISLLRPLEISYRQRL